MPLPKLTLVLGGASSGKSDFAESLVLEWEKSPAYIATAQAFDAEMQAKIAAHRRARGEVWRTIEAPLDLGQAFGKAGEDTVLLDCVTLWLSNHLLAESAPDPLLEGLEALLAQRSAPTVIVSNEVGQGIVPENALARQFRALQGRLNRRLAARADLVVQVVAGLPVVLKGQLP